MVRDQRSKTNLSDLEGAMTEREENLREVGIEFNLSESYDISAIGLEPNGFSGYGEFTPITIRSYTVPEDADLERDKQRD
jgi:hypothetical protein